MIAVSDLHVRFGRTRALDGVDLQLPAGQCVLLAGANGSGKTTLLRGIAGVLFPDRGRITLDGEDIYPRQRRRVANIAAADGGCDDLTLAQVLQLFASFHAGFHYREMDGCRFDLGRRFGALSRGEKTLFRLGLALAAEPEALLLDDLIHVLDPHLREVFLHLILALLAERRLTLVVAGQSAAEIEGVLERVVVLAHGRVVLDETVEELKRRFVRMYAAEPPAHMPVVYRREWCGVTEMYIYPYTPDPVAAGRVEFLPLPEILRAVIGGCYDPL